MAYESKERYFLSYMSLFRYHKLEFRLVFRCYNVLVLYPISGNKHYHILVPILVLWNSMSTVPIFNRMNFMNPSRVWRVIFPGVPILPQSSLLNMTASISISFSLTISFTSSQSIMKSQHLPHWADFFLISQAGYLACHTLGGISSL